MGKNLLITLIAGLLLGAINQLMSDYAGNNARDITISIAGGIGIVATGLAAARISSMKQLDRIYRIPRLFTAVSISFIFFALEHSVSIESLSRHANIMLSKTLAFAPALGILIGTTSALRNRTPQSGS